MYTKNIILLNEKEYFCISKDAYILGKSRDKCDGVIKASKAVSRIHCKFHHMGNGNYGVEDLQSANGTKINGYSIQAGMVYELHEGDVITLADDSFTVSYVVSQTINKNKIWNDCVYKVVVFHESLHMEIPFEDIDKSGVSIGTYPECTYRFEKGNEQTDFRVWLYCREDGNYVVTSQGGAYVTGQDCLSESEACLVLGHNIYICDQIGNLMFGIMPEVEYPVVGEDYDLYIDISKNDNFLIGSDSKSDIRIDDSRIGEWSMQIIKTADGYKLIPPKEVIGIRVNGVITDDSEIKIKNNQFFSFFGYSFCIDNQRLFTTKQADIITDFSYSVVQYANNHMPYPRFIRNVRQKYILENTNLEVLGPKPKSEEEDKNMLLTMLPLIMNMLIMVVLRGVVGGGGMFVVYCGATMLVSGAVSVATTINEGKERQRREKNRTERYLEYISAREDVIIKSRKKEKVLANAMNPTTRESLKFVDEFSNRLFEQQKNEPDYLSIRIGTGIAESVQPVKYKEEEYVETEDELASYPKVLSEKYQYLEDMPVMLSIKEINAVGCIGNRKRLYQMLKDMIVQFSTTHFYRDVKLCLILEEQDAEMFTWVRFLQNFQNDYTGMKNIMYDLESTRKGLEFLYEELSRREDASGKGEWEDYIVFVYRSSMIQTHPLADYIAKAKEYGFHFVFFEEYEELLHSECQKRIFLHDNEWMGYVQDVATGEVLQRFTYEYVTGKEVRKLAEKLACVYVDEVNLENNLTSNISLYELLKIHTPYELNLKERWSKSRIDESMAAPLGVKSGDEIVYLDIHEKAHGPHGLVAGTTGSGKSEIIQSYILSLATLFHPYEVGFVIIDFKGGGMANQFADLPHLIGTITNMDGDEVDRSLQSIRAELLKRQELFGKAGVNHIDEYIKKYRNHEVSEALPHLLLIVDEFAELKSEHPNFMKELISTARIGRSLGVHLILATQKPSGVINEQIWSNSRFKLCLKVQTKGDSNEVLKSPLASEIREPGRAYLQVGNDEIFQLFQSAYSGASSKNAGIESEREFKICCLDLAGRKRVIYEKKRAKNTAGITQLEELVGYIRDYCADNNILPLSPICLPPLPDIIPYTNYLRDTGGMDIVVPVGVVDDPARQTQYIETINVTQSNLFVLGSAKSGKTNLLETIIRGLTTLYTPEDVNIYIMDFASMFLKSYEQLVHVGGVVTATEDEKLKALLKLLQQTIQERRTFLAEQGLGSFAAYRESGARGIPQIVVILDNWIAFKNQFAEFEDAFINISRECLAAGISLIVTTSQSGGSGYKLISNFATRTAFYCNDSSDYSFLFEGCRLRIPSIAGRAMIEHGKQYYVCQYYQAFDAEKEYERISRIKEYIAETNKLYANCFVKLIPEMPENVDEEYLSPIYHFSPEHPFSMPLGIDYEDICLQTIDLEKESMLGIVGTNELDKNAYVEFLLHLLLKQSGKAPVKIYIVDDRERMYQQYSSQCYYTDQPEKAAEVLTQIIDIVEFRIKNRENGKKPENGDPFIVVLVQSQEAMALMTKEKQLSDKFRTLVMEQKGARVCFLFTDVPNAMVSFGASEAQKQLKQARQFLLYENLALVKAIDVPTGVTRKYKKELLPGEAYYLSGNTVKKIRMARLKRR